jgi:DNA-binding NtrC family response regulator
MAKILVLDDVYDAGIMIKKILERKGHTVYSFTDEDEAIGFAGKNRIDLAVLDIKLKKMSGIEVLERMKKMLPEMRAIILTGYPTLEIARAAISLGANEYCIKPIDKDLLEEKVGKVLGG